MRVCVSETWVCATCKQLRRTVTRARCSRAGRRSFTLIHLHTHSAGAAAADSWEQNYNHERSFAFVLYCFPWFRAAADLFFFFLGCALSSWFMAKRKKKQKSLWLEARVSVYAAAVFPKLSSVLSNTFCHQGQEGKQVPLTGYSKNLCPHKPLKNIDLFSGSIISYLQS